MYNTVMFIHIVDPYVPISIFSLIDFRNEYNIENDKKIYSLLGALNRIKGTLDVLDSILLLDK